jgi:hypothetical protein
MYKKILYVYLGVEIASILSLIILYYAKPNLDTTIMFWLSAALFLFSPIVMIIIAYALKKSQNSAKNHVLVYASRSRGLLDKSNVSSTLFFESEVNLNIYDLEEADEPSVTKISREARSLLKALIITALYVPILLYCKVGNKSIFMAAIVYGIIVFFYLFYFIIFIIETLTCKNDPILFTKKKIKAIKDFDEIDDSMQITDYKIYQKEMYITLPTDSKCVYALITKRKLYIVTLSNEDMDARDRINSDESLDVTKEFKNFFKDIRIEKYSISKEEIIEVLKIVRESLLK